MERLALVQLALMTVALGWAGAGASAQSRETLETEVSVSGNEVTVKWSKKHPWDQELVARGVSLYAEYRTARGPGLECLQARNGVPSSGRHDVGAGGCFAGNAVLRGEDRTVRFRLPDRVLAEPLGPVCLQLRLPGQRLLPIRRATKLGDDTARFQIDDWSRIVTARIAQDRLASRRAELGRVMALQAAEVAEQEASNASKGWATAQSCANQTPGTVESVRPGRPVAPQELQDAIARQVCVARLDGGRQHPALAPPPPMIPFDPAVLPEAIRDRWLKVRGSQLAQYVADWERFGGQVASYKKSFPVPHFGSPAEVIFLQSLAVETRARIGEASRTGSNMDVRDLLGLMGATVEAYDRCVQDGKRQLALNYEASRTLAEMSQTLPERLRIQAVQACRVGVEKLGRMRERFAGFEQELASVDAELAGFREETLPAKERGLNAIACAP